MLRKLMRILHQKMTVALVNEDQGTVFEGNKIAFGDQFVKNVNKKYETRMVRS